MKFALISVFVALLAVVELVVSTSVREVLSGFTRYFYDLSYERKQSIVSEAVQELQGVFPQGIETISLPESADIETCKATLQKAVNQNHEWYLLAMGQFTQLKFYNAFLNDKASGDLQEVIDNAVMAASKGSSDSIVVGGVLYDVQQLTQILSDAQSLREENVQLRNALSSVRADLEKSAMTIEELKLEAQSSLQEAIRAKTDVSKFEKKLSVCRRNEYNLKKIIYESKRGKFSKFKSAITKPFRAHKLKKALGKEGYKLHKQKKQADSKKRKELVKKIKKEIKQSKNDKRKKLLNKSIAPGEETPLSPGSEGSFSSEQITARSEASSSQPIESSGGQSSTEQFSAMDNSKSEKSDSSVASIFESSE
ncbi:putative signal peptide-containing protein secreted protein [Cryptosporidium canis]|nr:putative signal peptide-containing protein secreted protein [Cryptosporidium canis]